MSEEKKEEAGHGEEEGEKAKKKKLPVLWIIVGLLVVLIAVGGVLIVMLSGGGGEEKADKHGKKEHVEEEAHDEHAEEASAEGEHAAAEGEEGGHGGGDGEANCPHAVEEGGGHGAPKGPVLKDIYPLDPFIVNLSGESERNFLKVTVHLKLAKAECTPFVDPHVPEIRDSILLLLSSKEYEMIKSVQGKMELRDEVLERVDHIVKGNRVKGAFFTDFVAQ